MDVIKSMKTKLEVAVDQARGTDLEKKVKQATSPEKWQTATSSIKRELAQATFDYAGYREVMPALWKRMNESGKNWLVVLKSLELLDGLLKFGSERVIEESRERMYQIRTLQDFHHLDDTGVDRGGVIRDKAKEIVELLNDRKRLEAARKEAEKNKDKYYGISNSGRNAGFGSSSYGGGGGGNDSYNGGGGGAYNSGSYDSDNYGRRDKENERERERDRDRDRDRERDSGQKHAERGGGEEEEGSSRDKDKKKKKKKKHSEREKEPESDKENSLEDNSDSGSDDGKKKKKSKGRKHKKLEIKMKEGGAVAASNVHAHVPKLDGPGRGAQQEDDRFGDFSKASSTASSAAPRTEPIQDLFTGLHVSAPQPATRASQPFPAGGGGDDWSDFNPRSSAAPRQNQSAPFTQNNNNVRSMNDGWDAFGSSTQAPSRAVPSSQPAFDVFASVSAPPPAAAATHAPPSLFDVFSSNKQSSLPTSTSAPAPADDEFSGFESSGPQKGSAQAAKASGDLAWGSIDGLVNLSNIKAATPSTQKPSQPVFVAGKSLKDMKQNATLDAFASGAPFQSAPQSQSRPGYGAHPTGYPPNNMYGYPGAHPGQYAAAPGYGGGYGHPPAGYGGYGGAPAGYGAPPFGAAPNPSYGAPPYGHSTPAPQSQHNIFF